MTIDTLRRRYGAPVGYSGHEASVEPSLVAAMLGAVAIERHITLDRAMYGLDQSASLEPDELKILVARLGDLREWLGDGEKRITPGEASVAESCATGPATRPKGAPAYQFFQGAPFARRSSRYSFSRSVSIGCQKPSWR